MVYEDQFRNINIQCHKKYEFNEIIFPAYSIFLIS